MPKHAKKLHLTKEVLEQIKSKLDEMEGKEVEPGAVFSLAVANELVDRPLTDVTVAWSIEIRRGPLK